MGEQLPEYFQEVMGDSSFSFACHLAVPCFTECCRELDLALTPYDVLRLKRNLRMDSGSFLEQHVIIEWDSSQLFPTCYLTMVDDGRASCVFVSEKGCQVYEDRPSACRAYPVGRGVSQKTDGTVEERFVLLKEPHCRGYEEEPTQSPRQYFSNQGLEEYNRFNDAVMQLVQHDQIKNGFRPSRHQLDDYILALYNLDMFRQEIANGRISMNRPLSPLELQGVAGYDEQLLLLAIQWLRQDFFGE